MTLKLNNPRFSISSVPPKLLRSNSPLGHGAVDINYQGKWVESLPTYSYITSTWQPGFGGQLCVFHHPQCAFANSKVPLWKVRFA
jgi:hypothetical protein